MRAQVVGADGAGRARVVRIDRSQEFGAIVGTVRRITVQADDGHLVRSSKPVDEMSCDVSDSGGVRGMDGDVIEQEHERSPCAVVIGSDGDEGLDRDAIVLDPDLHFVAPDVGERVPVSIERNGVDLQHPVRRG